MTILTHNFLPCLPVISLCAVGARSTVIDTMNPPNFCAPVRSGMSAPVNDSRSAAKQQIEVDDRSLSPLSATEEGPISYYERKRTRTLRFPCKARGVTDNHNARTAYIDVPPTAGHGSIVICSHPACASSGRKFRFCIVCQTPVAKRNFSKRHAHGILQAPDVPPGTEEEEEAHGDDGSLRSKRQRLGTFASWGEALQLLQEDIEDIEISAEKEERNIPASSPVPQTIVVGETAPSVSETFADVSAASVESDLTAQERQWLALFRQRPTHGAVNEADARAWMTAILETAELKPAALNTHSEDTDEVGEEDNAAEDEDDGDSSIYDLLRDKAFLED